MAFLRFSTHQYGFAGGLGRPLKNWNGVSGCVGAPDSLELRRFWSICIVSAVGVSDPSGPDHLKCIGFHAFSLCGQWGGGLGRPLIHWKCLDFQAYAWLRRWGGRQCSPNSPPILCRTKSTGVPRVCGDVSNYHTLGGVLLQDYYTLGGLLRELLYPGGSTSARIPYPRGSTSERLLSPGGSTSAGLPTRKTSNSQKITENQQKNVRNH